MWNDGLDSPPHFVSPGLVTLVMYRQRVMSDESQIQPRYKILSDDFFKSIIICNRKVCKRDYDCPEVDKSGLKISEPPKSFKSDPLYMKLPRAWWVGLAWSPP